MKVRLSRMTRSAVPFAGALGCVFVVAGQAGAHPVQSPFWGPTGLGAMPTAETVPADHFELGIGVEDIDPILGSVREFPVVTGTLGVQRGEIGFAYARERTEGPGFSIDNDYWAAHGKWRLFERKNGLQAAVGAHYLSLGDVPGHVTSLYATGSYPLIRKKRSALLGHFGVLHNRIDSGLVANETRTMAGLEWRLSPRFAIAGDFVRRRGIADSVASIVARYQNGPWSAQIGTGEFRSNDRRLFVSAAYRFDWRASQAGDVLLGNSKAANQPKKAGGAQ